MKERAMSAIHREKVCLRLQCNYKQLRLNFSAINELSLVIYGYGISEGQGSSSRKIMEIPGGGGSAMKPQKWKIQGGGGETGKNLCGGYGYFLEPHNVY